MLYPYFINIFIVKRMENDIEQYLRNVNIPLAYLDHR